MCYYIIFCMIRLWIPTWSAFPDEKNFVEIIPRLEHFSKIVDWKIIDISLKINFSADILKNR